MSQNDEDPQPGPSSRCEGASGGGEPTTLLEFLSLPENKDANFVTPLTWCPHLEFMSETIAETEVTLQSPCLECGHVGENWICLHCGEVHCSRYVNEHMLFHGIEKEHKMTLSFSDLSAWCYGCDSYVDNLALKEVKNKFHVMKFGVKMPERSTKDQENVLELI